MRMREIMRPGAFAIASTDGLGNAYTAMNRSRIRHLPVVDDGKLVGILSERDVLAARARCENSDWWTTPIARAMHAPAQTAGPEDSLSEVAGRMAGAKIGALPIVERGKLVGLVTATDILDAEVRESMRPAPRTLATAADAMTPYPFVVEPEQLLVDAAAVMFERHVRHLPVVDAARAVVGMLSERDVRTAVGDPVVYLETRGRSEAQPRVKDVMTRPALTVRFDEPLLGVARRFGDHHIGAVPVCDASGGLIGIVSYVDALRVLAR
ncbi:MAG: CBS domain-containing protein [Deltaproteobacteria bacterium]|nr:CBS domain-containing protein [Deltaproteobacteria bacterium]